MPLAENTHGPGHGYGPHSRQEPELTEKFEPYGVSLELGHTSAFREMQNRAKERLPGTLISLRRAVFASRVF